MCIFTYDIIAQDWAIQFFLRFGMICLLFGMLFIYYTKYILMNSSHAFKDSKSKYVNFIICVLASLYFIFSNFIEFKEAVEGLGNINISIGLIEMGIMLLILLYLLFVSIYITYNFALKKMPHDTREYKNCRLFMIGLITFVGTLFVNVVSQFSSNDTVGAIFDALTYVFMLLGMILLSLSVLKKQNSNEKTIKSE